MNIGFLLSFIIIIGIEFTLQYVLSMFNVPKTIITLVVNFVISIVFAILNYMGREKLKNPSFHRTIAIYFVVLTIFSLIFGQFI